MDNARQIMRIEQYRQRLSRLARREIEANIAAQLWIRKYARLWRLSHPVVEECVLQ